MDWPILYLTGEENHTHTTLWKYLLQNFKSKIHVVYQPQLRLCPTARWKAHQRAWKIIYEKHFTHSIVIEDSVIPPPNVDAREWEIKFNRLQQRIDKVPSWKLCALDSHYKDKIRTYAKVDYGRLIDTHVYALHWSGAEEWYNHRPVYDIQHFFRREYHYFVQQPWFGNQSYVPLNSLTIWGILGLVALLLLLLYLILTSLPEGKFNWHQLLVFDKIN